MSPIAPSKTLLVACVLLAIGLLAPTATVVAQADSTYGWTSDGSLTPVENLNNLLLVLEQQFAADRWYLELHFQSLRTLIETYPPSDAQAEELIATFTNADEGLNLANYLTGRRQLLVAYDSNASGALSYVRYTLPSGYLRNPTGNYPVYAWARGGGPDYYPSDIENTVYPGQLSGMPIEGTPSGSKRAGFTIMPGALGGRDYTGNEAEDFFQGLDGVLSRFDEAIDRNRLYMGGFSNGGKGTFLLTSVSMDTYHWAAIGLCAPAVTTQSMIDGYIDALSEVPVWLAVGAEDGLSASVRILRDAFEEIGNPPKVYYEVGGLGHEWTWEFQTNMYDFFNQYAYDPDGPFFGKDAITLKVEASAESPGLLRLLITSPIATEVRLMNSTDLQTWTLVESLQLASGETHISEITASEDGPSALPRFFKLEE